MQNIIQKFLKFLAKRIIKKYKPEIIGITGSVGKTSTKEAVFAVLKKEFRVRQSIRSYNNRIGLPLTVIGRTAPGRSPIGWCKVLGRGLGLILRRDKNYPQILVLEMAADKPGDLDYLLNIAKPKIGILTAIAPVHLESFKTVERVQKEKRKILTILGVGEYAIVNSDDSRVMEESEKTKARIFSFGESEKSNVQFRDAALSAGQNNYGEKPIAGTSFKLVQGGSTVPVFLPDALGKAHVYAAAAAAAVGVVYDMNLLKIGQALKEYQPPAGRMRLLNGIKQAWIIDDSYNSSPRACAAALDILQSIKLAAGNKKYAILGDMLDLGDVSSRAHRAIGEKAAQAADILVTVGKQAELIAKYAKEKGLIKEQVHSFDACDKAGRFVQDQLQKGDLILVKGSRDMRMERVVKELMADPLRASELLVG